MSDLMPLHCLPAEACHWREVDWEVANMKNKDDARYGESFHLSTDSKMDTAARSITAATAEAAKLGLRFTVERSTCPAIYFGLSYAGAV